MDSWAQMEDLKGDHDTLQGTITYPTLSKHLGDMFSSHCRANNHYTVFREKKPETKMGEVAKLTPTGNPLSPHRTNPERL